MKLLAIALFLAAAACGGKSSATAVPPVPTVGDGGEPLPPPDGMTGNPNGQGADPTGPKSNQP